MSGQKKLICIIIYIFSYCAFHFIDRLGVAAAGSTGAEGSTSIEYLRAIVLRNWDTLVSRRKNDLSTVNEYGEDEEQRIEALGIGFIGDLFLLPIERSSCGAWDSCVLRCGDALLGAPYMCSCDPDCLEFDDCCVDFKYYCGNPQNGSTLFSTTDIQQQQEQEQGQDFDHPFGPFEGKEKGFKSSIFEERVEDEKSDITGPQCLKMGFDPSSYGYWYLDGKPTTRKCIIRTPSWCEPGNYDQFGFELPMSLSLLLNFGPQGWNNDLLFSSDYYDPLRCPNVWEIWDPFTNICRQMSCNSEYSLNDGKCVWDGVGRPPTDEEFLFYHTKTANITFYGQILMDEAMTTDILPQLRDTIADSLSRKIRINPTRFSNVVVQKGEDPSRLPYRPTTISTSTTTMAGLQPITETYAPPINGSLGTEEDPLWISTEDGFPVVVNFTLGRKMQNSTHELTIEQMLSVLNEAMTIRAVLLSDSDRANEDSAGDSKGVPMKINGVYKCMEKEEIDFFKQWCRGGDLLTYWNEDVEVLFVIKNKTEGFKFELDIRVQPSNKTYEEGSYVANILCQTSDFGALAANISGVAVVCENRPSIVNETCTRLHLNDTEFEMQEDGSLIYKGEIPGIGPRITRSEYAFTEDGEVLTCVNADEAKKPHELPEPTTLETLASYLTMLMMMLSLLGLFGTILTYGLFSTLRTLPGWCLIHLCIGEFVFYLLFILGVRRSTADKDMLCMSVAIALHLSALVFFAWSSVISYDLFQTFAKFQAVTRSRQKYLWRYMIAGYGVPVLIVFTSMMVEFHSDVHIDYGKTGACWINNSMAALYIFALPMALSIMANITFFILTVRGIQKVSKISTSSNQKDRARFTLYVRISSVQCFAWIFGFLTVLTHFSELTSTIFEFLFLTLSSLQGLYIFFAFVFNKRVFSLYKTMLKGGGDLDSDESGRYTSSIKSRGDHTPTIVKRNGTKKRNDDVVKSEAPNRHRVVSRTDDPVMVVSTPSRKSSGNHHNPVAGRTVSNETCVSFVSLGSDDSSV